MSQPSTSASDGSNARLPRRQLSLFDTTSIIVGIIIGSGLFETPPLVASNVKGAFWFLSAWAAGGIFALVGSLCYAELATSWPHEGGDYVYLTRAFGRPWGFVFGWCQLWIIRPGSVGAIAFIFARYAVDLFPLLAAIPAPWIAAGAVLLLTSINVLGVRQGKWTQNLLTAAKVVGLLVVVLGGFAASGSSTPARFRAPLGSPAGIEKALIFVMFAYSGWNEMAFVAAEVRHPHRNILRALLLGTGTVALIYLLVNAAYLHALDFAGVQSSSAVAADVARLAFGDRGRYLLDALICISALGAINGMVLTGGRIFYAMGTEHPFLRPLGQWSPRFGTPARSLWLQALITVAVVLGFGLAVDAESGRSGFEKLVIFTSPVFWFFLLLTGLAYFPLRRQPREQPQPFRVPAYPWLPLLFCAGSVYMLYSSLSYAVQNRSVEAVWSIGLFAVGALACRFRGGAAG